MFEPERLTAPDEMGFFFHPDIPGEDESDDVAALLKDLGFEVSGVLMKDDNDELSDAWHEDDDVTAPTSWTPTPPKGDGWILVAKFDSDYGPAAMFVKKINP